MYKILKNIIEMDDYSVQKLSNQPPESFEWNTVEGTELNVSDCIGGKGKIEVKGNTYQKKLSGKNLFNHYLYPRSVTQKGVTVTNNGDGSFTLNGTCTENNTIFNLGQTEDIKKYVNEGAVTHTAYYISGSCTKGQSSSARTIIRLNYDTGTDKMIPLQDLSTQKVISKINPQDSRNDGWSWAFVLASGDSFNNFTIKYQVEKGTVGTDWEPYCGGQPSPNPLYPQNIEVVTGNNVIKHVGKNEFYGGNINTIWYNSDSGKFTSSTTFKSFIMKVKPNTQYVISKKNASNRFAIVTSQSEPAVGNYYKRLVVGYNGANTSYAFKTENDENYILFGVYNGTDETEIAKAIEEIQLEEGSTPTQYEPYRGEDYNLNLGSIELCKIGDYEDIPFKNVAGDENYNVELEVGAWYKKKVIDKKFLDGEMYFANSGVTNVFYTPVITNYSRINNKPFCDNFKGFNNVDTGGSVNIINSVGFNNTYNHNRLYISFNGTIDELKDFLNERKPTLYYANDNLTYEKITDQTLISQLEALRKFKWFRGVNHIWTETDNLDPVLAGTYKQSIQSETQNSIANLQVQANEQSISNTPESEV